jgi:hypothetical protein
MALRFSEDRRSTWFAVLPRRSLKDDDAGLSASTYAPWHPSSLTIAVRCMSRRPCAAMPRLAIAQLHTTPIVAKKKRPRADRTPGAPPPPPTAQNPTPSNPAEQSVPPPEITPQSDPPPASEASSSNSSPSEDPQPPPPNSKGPDTLLNEQQYEAFRTKQTQGVFTWKTVVLFLLTGTGLVVYFQYEKERVNRLRNFQPPVILKETNGRCRGREQGCGDTENRWSIQSGRPFWK